MKKGIVMEIDDTCLTLLTPDGQFLQAKKQEHPYTLGEEILFVPLSQKRFVKHFLGIKQLSVAAAALCLFLGSLFPVYQSNKAYAYMSIDVNPSIELGLNKQMQVVKVTTFNSEGKKVISHIGDWKKKSVTELTQKVLREMKREGYLRTHHALLISTVRTGNPEEKTEKQFTKDMGQIKELAKENNLKVTVLNGTEKELEKAHQLGITTGKYKEAKINSGKKKNNNKASNSVKNPSNNENNGKDAPINSLNSTVNQDENGAVDLNTPEQNNNGNIDQGKAVEHQIPPGQLKKAEEPPKWQQSKEVTKSDKSEINKNQSKKQSNPSEYKGNGNKKD